VEILVTDHFAMLKHSQALEKELSSLKPLQYLNKYSSPALNESTTLDTSSSDPQNTQ
jgi:hypothetical protein